MPAGSPVSGTRVWSDPNSGGTTDFLVRPELRRQFRAFFILTELKNHHTKENRHEKHGKNHGQDRGPVQKSGLRLCRLRNLRGPGQHLGLRSSGRGAEEQHQKGVVEEVRSGEPLQRGAGRRHPHEPPDLGGQRPSVRLLRSSDGLPGVQGAVPGGQAH